MSTILIVDDEPRILILLKGLLKNEGHEILTSGSGAEALEIFRKNQVDIVLTDLRMEPMDGMALFRAIHAKSPATPVLLLTAYATVETAVSAMREGVFDYLAKPFKKDELMAQIRRAEENVAQAHSTATSTGSEAPLRYRFENLIAASEAMTRMCDTIQRIAPTSATVLINGESGTGKEVIARTIHRASSRADKPWVAVNCAALPENLLESEMFGHVKGAFTGAHADKRGLFEAADGGTLFLDEISSMPLALQAKFLRVLQEREIRRVGGTQVVPVDVRVIAASNTNLEEDVLKGTFRSDLYYRFAVITVDIPPLRERVDDILPLARHFIQSELPPNTDPMPISGDAARQLKAYPWPGNVRELENAIRHAMAFWQDGELSLDLLPPKIRNWRPAEADADAGDETLKKFLRRKEREYIERILNESNGDKGRAAEVLNVNLSTLYRKLSEDESAASNRS